MLKVAIAVVAALSFPLPTHAEVDQPWMDEEHQLPVPELPYQDRLQTAETPDERAGIQAEIDLLMQSGITPGPVQTFPVGPAAEQESESMDNINRRR